MNNKTIESKYEMDPVFLGIQEVSHRAGVHPNTVRNKCLDTNPKESCISKDGKKIVIELNYAAERLGVDVDKLYTFNSGNVHKSIDGINVNRGESNVNIIVTKAKDEVIKNHQSRIDSLEAQLANKDEQIIKLISELSESRNQSNIILKNIQDNFLPTIESQQKTIEAKESENKKRKGWWSFRKS
ncbi:MAG: hypothetical protein AAGF07_03715 [Patescibacteria group bacterium]